MVDLALENNNNCTTWIYSFNFLHQSWPKGSILDRMLAYFVHGDSLSAVFIGSL